MPLSIIPPQLASVQARMTGKAWWVAVFADGRELPGWRSDWPALDKRGLRQIRLHCPDGGVASLDSDTDYRLFQFGRSEARVGAGTRPLIHVIGRLEQPTGFALMYLWNYQARALLGPIWENINAVGLSIDAPPIGPMSWDALGVAW